MLLSHRSENEIERFIMLDLINCGDFIPKEKIVRRRYLVALEMIYHAEKKQ